MKFKLFIIGVFVFCANLALAQNEFPDVPTISQTHLIKNAYVIVKPGDLPVKSSILISEGIIKAVGNNFSIPADAIPIDADSLYVYAGFISGFSHTGIPEPKRATGQAGNTQRDRIKDPGNPPNDLAGITPERKAKDFIKHDDKSIKSLREAGITASHVVPRGNMLPGHGAIVFHGGNDIDDLIYRENSMLFAQLSSARRMYPATVIGVMAKWRELFTQAKYAGMHLDTYNRNPVGTKRPVYEPPVMALIPAQQGKIPVMVKTPKVLDIQRTFALQNDLGFELLLADVQQGWHTIDKIKSSETPVFLALKIPKEKKVKKEEEEKGKEEKKDKKKRKKKTKEEKKEVKKEDDAEMKMLKAKKKAAIAEYQKQAAVFEDANIDFGFSTLAVKPNEIHGNLRLMINAGLSEKAALAALTTNPANILGLSEVLGTIEAGKIANLVITNKSYFEEEAKIKMVFVDGSKYVIKKNDKKAPQKRSRDSEERNDF